MLSRKNANTYCFYFPSLSVGGCEFAFIRFAKYLSTILNKKVYYVDYPDIATSLARKELKGTSVTFIDYIDGQNSYDLFEEEVCMIAPFTMHGQIPKFKNTKVLYWLMHPENVNWLKSRAQLKKKKLISEIKKLNNKNAISCMDLVCFNETQKFFKFKLKKQYVPVPCNVKNKIAPATLIDNDTINIAWLGRLDSDKIYALINLLEQFDSYKTNLKKKIHIIGSGSSKELIDETKYKIDIVWTSTLLNDDLDNYLIDHVDILFAMGMSCLEGANLRIPTILLSYGLEFFQTDTYHWLFGMSDYTLGYNVKHETEYALFKRVNFSAVINAIYLQNKKEQYGRLCLEYSNSHHTLDAATRCLITYCDITKYRLEKPLVPKKKNIFKRIFCSLFKRIKS